MAEEEGNELTLCTLIRKEWYQQRWFYSVVDIVGYLTGSENPRRYWSDLKRRVSNEGYAEVYAKCVQLKMLSSDGKQRLTDMADRESQGVPELQRDAKDGGAVAGRARKDIEGQLGTSVVSEQNYLEQPKQKQIEQSSLFDEPGEV